MDNLVEIKTDDLPINLDKFTNPSDLTDLLINPDKQLWVSEGVPVKSREGVVTEIDIPNKPHAFVAHNLWVRDSEHVDTLLMDVPVIFAHGYREGNVWKFANGQPVVDTVDAYDEYARHNNLPQIEFVIACNKDRSDNPLDIQVKDFPVEKVISQSMGQFVQFYPGHNSQVSMDGNVTLTVGIENGKFWDLDKLISHREDVKKIEILD